MNASTSASPGNNGNGADGGGGGGSGGGGSGVFDGDGGDSAAAGPVIDVDRRNHSSGGSNYNLYLRKSKSTSGSVMATMSADHVHSNDEQIYKMAPEAVDPAILSRGSLSTQRYTRSALMLLRDEGLSKCRPDCSNDPRLSNLGFWRQDAQTSSSHSYTQSYPNASGTATSGRGGGGGNSNSGNSSVRTNFGNGGGGASSSSNASNSKNALDHRSISSAHLMPAFMKRRTIGSLPGDGSSASGGIPSGGQTCEPVKETSQRHRKDAQHQSGQSHHDIILSPQKKSINMGCQMPSSVANQYSDRELPGNLRERRIGSGRLPPRDVNWDYRPEKETLSSAGNENDNFSSGGGGGPNRPNGGQQPFRAMQGGGGGGSNQEFKDHRYDRRSYGRNSTGANDYTERTDNRDSSNSSYTRRFIDAMGNPTGASHGFSSGERRSKQYNDSRLDEPEWLNAGPISQHDTIELRGFDDVEDAANYHDKDDNIMHSYKSHKSASSSHSGRGAAKRSSDTNNSKLLKDVSHDIQGDDTSHATSNQHTPPPARSTPAKNIHDTNNNNAAKSESVDGHAAVVGNISTDDQKQNTEDRDSKHVNLNFEEILKMESLNDMLVSDNSVRKAGSSRFSQWFKHTSPTNQAGGSRRSSLHDELTNMVNVDPNHSMLAGTPQHQQRVLHPSQMKGHRGNSGDKYFVPIQPVASNNRQPQPPTNHALLEFLMKNNFIGQNAQHAGNMGQTGLSNQNTGPTVAIPSVEELEARMRKNEKSAEGSCKDPQQSNPNQLNKLLSANAATSGSVHPNQWSLQNVRQSSPPQPQDMETFRKLITALQQQQQQQQQQQHHHQQQQQMILQQMLLNRSQQQQRSLQQQIQVQQQQQQQQQQVLQKFIQANSSDPINRNDLMKLPEAQNIMQGISRGDITQNSLLQQLASSSTSARDREIIITVLNYLNQQQQHQQQQQQHSNSSPVRPTISPSVIQQHFQLQQHLNKTPNNNNNNGNVPLSIASNSSGGTDCCGGTSSMPNSGASATNLLCAPVAVPSATTSTIIHQASNAPARNELLQTHLIFQQQSQKQLRLSPLHNGLPQRIPSPRELQFHTQSIMQNALIKKKLEEQQENYRRRQEIEKQHQQTQQQQHHGGGSGADAIDTSIQQQPFGNSPTPNQQPLQSHNKQVNSPTPLAFTPTSVLRKMTAEKDCFLNGGATGSASDPTKSLNAASNAMQSLLLSNVAAAVSVHQQQQQQHQSQPRMILGSGSTLQQQQDQHNPQPFPCSNSGSGVAGPSISPQAANIQQAIRNNQVKYLHQVPQLQKPMGRPILKGRTIPTSTDPSPNQSILMQGNPPQMNYGSKMEFHQQQQQQQQQPPPQAGAQQQQLQHLQLLQHRHRVRVHQQYQQMYRQQVMHKPSGAGGPIPLNNVTDASPASFNANLNQRHAVIPSAPSGVAAGSGMMNIGNTGPGSLQPAAVNSPTNVQNNATSNNNGGIDMNYQRDGGLSPTSNQLARWFSPELLAKASAGKLPSLNTGQVLSLEEFERSIQHSSAAVHN